MIRVLLAEDMHMVRGALVALLDLEPDIVVVAEVDTGDQIMPMVRRHDPDVAVIDVDLPVVDGLTVAGTIRSTMPSVRTLMLTTLARPGTLRRALAAGVDGFILKDAPPAKLAAAIRDVNAGRRVVDSQLALAAWDRGECPLTERELEVLRLAADGTDAPDIARLLSLSSGTVRNYLTAVVAKLDARNRVDAIRIALDAGWL
ncbi:response regulator transcription factor [Umezawaea tangerina]|uniref:LuxR family two component transcriptional regulator n=1 Tax=Umezawaea tangerina TaxID=84725 RepID=A0A2T0THY2_9PSEU|nr:response regulator transcription factor [Umezawaea tangerina]PRY45178.1 LuxR family two component transcriptional regulator [Umezawaea tangerina]